MADEKITGVVITLNEERNIGDCLRNLKQVCSELIVVDSRSSDLTVDIAEEEGATVMVQRYLGDGPQKNVALPKAQNRWILSLDADERLSDEMVEAIKGLSLSDTERDSFSFPRRNFIGSRWIRRCGWYPDRCVRLFNKEKTKFREVKQHSYVEGKNIGELKGDILHYSFKNVGELFAKPDRNFSTRGAKILYEQGKKTSALGPFIHGSAAFFRQYILRLGFLEGVDGFSVSLSAGVNHYLKYAKLLEYYRDEKVLGGEDFNRVW